MALKKILTFLLLASGFTSFAQQELSVVPVETQHCIVNNLGCVSLPEGEISNMYLFSIEELNFSNQEEATKFAGFHSSNLHRFEINMEDNVGILRLQVDDVNAFQTREGWINSLTYKCQ